MRVTSRRTALHHRTIFRAVVFIGATLMTSELCTAGMITYSINVPKVLENKPAGGLGGWGALVIEFNSSADTASFIFQPNCPDPTEGIAEPESHGMLWQLGPAIRYGLPQTGTPSGEAGSPNYGPFLITLTFEGNTAPTISSAFWQSKPSPGGVTTWTFNDKQDLMAQVKQFSVVPEPSTLTLALLAAPFLSLAFARQRFASRQRPRTGPKAGVR